MKVIIKGKVIETGFIKSIELLGDDNTWYDPYVNITFIIGDDVNFDLGETIFKSDPEYQNKLYLIHEEFQRILKFLEDHSDKPSWPYPIFE